MTFKQRLEWLFERKMIMLFLWEKRFLNPLIPKEMKKLNSTKIFNDEKIWSIIDKYIPKYKEHLPTGMYFPVPISKALKEGVHFSSELALRFHYEFIKIDENQTWNLQNKLITGKVLKLFKLNIFYQKETNQYFIEYRSDDRWDKCYLDCEITPMLALSIMNHEDGLKIELNNQKIDTVDLHTFRVDQKERCFVRSKNFGEVMLADAPRFWFFNHLDETGSNFVFNKNFYSLRISK